MVEKGIQLLDTVLLYLGDAQHFFDAPNLLDQMMMLYRNNFDDAQRTSIWYLHILLVLAIAKLLRGELDDVDDPPGFAFFDEALQLLPSVSEIRTPGIDGIEVLALMAV